MTQLSDRLEGTAVESIFTICKERKKEIRWVLGITDIQAGVEGTFHAFIIRSIFSGLFHSPISSAFCGEELSAQSVIYTPKSDNRLATLRPLPTCGCVAIKLCNNSKRTVRPLSVEIGTNQSKIHVYRDVLELPTVPTTPIQS